MNDPGIPYFSLVKQGKKNLRTLIEKERYDFGEEDVEEVTARVLEEEGLLYGADGRSASVAGDIRTTDEATAENAAAFLEGEFEDEEVLWAYSLEEEGEIQGAVATFYDPEDPNIVDGPGMDRYLVPSSVVQVLGAVEDSEQMDIHVERYDRQDVRAQLG